MLLWGPRDERPDENGIRLRDSQCGLFATGKVLRRFQVPFTYMTNCRLNDPEFERGIRDFLRVCNVVKTFYHTRILQIAPRPFDFWTTMCNEGELLEKFNIQLSPIPMPELTKAIRIAKETDPAVKGNNGVPERECDFGSKRTGAGKYRCFKGCHEEFGRPSTAATQLRFSAGQRFAG